MATSQFSASCSRTRPFPHYESRSRLIDFTCRSSKSKLFFTRSLNRKQSRRSFSVKSVSSEPTQKLKDPIADEEASTTLSSLTTDAASVASSIKYHAEFTPSFSPERLDLPKAYFATAQSVRDSLIINWNATYDYYEKLNVKQAYYLSMEFLQGRALLNAVGNLELRGAYAEALNKLGHKLEEIASQEPDAALGNGGLGRLASCFLDSLATLNYPAWGYGLRYRYGLFKQLITKDGQEEIAEDWLESGNPWEIVRNDVSYPVKFYGKVVTGSDGIRHWIGGEDIKAVAHDVPIPGYQTKTTINLRLWSTKAPSEDFDLNAFNSGEHTKAYEALGNAEKICYVLYPGDESIEGKVLRLKQQYTLCSASLQDIIARFERRSGASVNWEEFPEKVAVQMNDTHPTLCIPELMRILIDLKGLSWKDAWNITQRTVAYTNHTVLPEALEKWSFELMQKLLPRHIEIIQLIDEEVIGTIISEYGTADYDLLEKKLKEMRILENVDYPEAYADILVKPKEIEPVEEVEIENVEKVESLDEEDKLGEESPDEKEQVLPEPVPEPPKLVRMANLCVVGGHAVNGVAEIHSEIVKEEVFNSFYQLWPEKFQNKTNGVTPRRWIRFCNPDLSEIITKWIGTEEWVLDTEKLAGLRKFADNEDLHRNITMARKASLAKNALATAAVLFAIYVIFNIFHGPTATSKLGSALPLGTGESYSISLNSMKNLQNSAGNPVRIYLYDLPTRFTYGVIQHHSLARGGKPVDDLTKLNYPGHQHMAEWHLFKDLLRPNSERTGSAVVRVSDPDDAELFYVPFFSSLSLNVNPSRPAAEPGLDPVRPAYNDEETQEALVEWLEAQEYWKRNDGRDHVIIASDPNALYRVIDSVKKSVLLVSDFGRLRRDQGSLVKDVILPYSHRVNIYQGDIGVENRNTLLFFMGARYRKEGGKVRDLLFQILGNEDDVTIKHGVQSRESRRAASHGMHSSKFCLNPAGDTPSACRLFDSIVSLCVPVIISDDIELPFEDVIDYRKIAIFVETTVALKPGFLVSMLRAITTERILEYQKELKEVKHYFDYGSGTVNEIWRQVAQKLPLIKLMINRDKRFVKRNLTEPDCSCLCSNQTGILTSY